MEKVDVVLLEGFDISSYKSLARKDPIVIPVILSLKFSSFLVDAIIWLQRLRYKLALGIGFRGDAPHAFELARKYSKRVEIVDASLFEVYEKMREVFVKSSEHFILALLEVPALVTISTITLLVMHFLLRGLPLSSLPPLLVVLPFQLLAALANPKTLAPLMITSVLTALAWCSRTFIRGINSFRDTKVVERVCELAAKGYNVLVVRGKRHVKFIAQELQKRGVPYEIVH
jgi:hypothetical protein